MIAIVLEFIVLGSLTPAKPEKGLWLFKAAFTGKYTVSQKSNLCINDQLATSGYLRKIKYYRKQFIGMQLNFIMQRYR
ncbi:hypothetical protein [Methylophilus aquaticus]|uniref:Uncharacterized protein n=1 Tax=Methylophilus aquaticus TaxID=1971610 RepID=A0ABT9JNS9_9PROT|nr:hypothetical protein [Methylophilus aquaticus]MDP8566253.1 hypothetical protein [Methylophilus aquaticus]